MKHTTFQEWLKLREEGTGTNCVAVFARPVFGEPVRREWPHERKEKRKDKRKS